MPAPLNYTGNALNRPGTKLLHQLPPDAKYALLGPKFFPRIAIVVCPSRDPYYVLADGTTQPLFTDWEMS